MAILKVARMGHPVLRQECTPIPPEKIKDPEVQRLDRALASLPGVADRYLDRAARLERHLAKVMEDVAVEAATAALRRIEPRRARLRRVSEGEGDGAGETSSHTV